MSKLIDLTGQTFNRLTVISKSTIRKDGEVCWNCLCDCGGSAIIRGRSLRNNDTGSCGCINAEITSELNSIHGMHGSPEYNAWKNMKQRCYNPNNEKFYRYGGRGIIVCDEWQNDFITFFNYIGYKPSGLYSIERINNDGNYEPGNVKWAMPKQQSNNRRNNHTITINGWSLTLTQWSDFTGINATTIRCRIKRGWPKAKAVFQPVYCPSHVKSIPLVS